MNTQWSRRKFLQTVACASTLGCLDRLAPRGPAFSPMATQLRGTSHISPAGFAYVGSSGKGADASSNLPSAIHVFDVYGNRWRLKQSLASRDPAFLALHPTGRFLYAVNQVDDNDGLPCG